jgi:hypothetical protein
MLVLHEEPLLSSLLFHLRTLLLDEAATMVVRRAVCETEIPADPSEVATGLLSEEAQNSHAGRMFQEILALDPPIEPHECGMSYGFRQTPGGRSDREDRQTEAATEDQPPRSVHSS